MPPCKSAEPHNLREEPSKSRVLSPRCQAGTTDAGEEGVEGWSCESDPGSTGDDDVGVGVDDDASGSPQFGKWLYLLRTGPDEPEKELSHSAPL